MRARDMFSPFFNAAHADSDKGGIREGIYSDVFGTLIVRGQLDVRYYQCLLWAQSQGIPVTLMSSEPGRATKALQEMGCADSLVLTMKDKLHILNTSDAPLEVVIDDDLLFEPAIISINPATPEFKRFVATSRYKNPGKSHPEGLLHRLAL